MRNELGHRGVGCACVTFSTVSRKPDLCSCLSVSFLFHSVPFYHLLPYAVSYLPSFTTDNSTVSCPRQCRITVRMTGEQQCNTDRPVCNCCDQLTLFHTRVSCGKSPLRSDWRHFSARCHKFAVGHLRIVGAATRLWLTPSLSHTKSWYNIKFANSTSLWPHNYQCAC